VCIICTFSKKKIAATDCFAYFVPPKDDGGSEITKYIVELNDGKGMYCYEIC
jgi:hypothetical protein